MELEILQYSTINNTYGNLCTVHVVSYGTTTGDCGGLLPPGVQGLQGTAGTAGAAWAQQGGTLAGGGQTVREHMYREISVLSQHQQTQVI